MSDFEISVKTNVDELAKELDDFARKQLPFAVSLALNKMARMIDEGEIDQITKTFPTATPFTKKGMGYVPATKDRLETVVFMKDVQEGYLEPYEFGGKQIPAKPSGTAMIEPVGIGVNVYGNIPYQKLQNMKAMKSVFTSKGMKAGGLKLKDGRIIRGVFQRMSGRGGGPRLKILVRFQDPVEVTQHLDYFKRAEDIVNKNFDMVMEEALDTAMATRK